MSCAIHGSPRLLAACLMLLGAGTAYAADPAAGKPAAAWTVGTPIVTYWAGRR